jgi:hypothetical protein
MNSIQNLIRMILLWSLAIAFVIFYPMLISIYVFLPLLVGVMGYVLMLGIETNRISYIIIPLLYFLNIEVNLSLPYFLTLIASLLIYVLFFRHLNYFRKCAICRPILSVVLMDLLYLSLLLSYDFIFSTSSIVVDNILLYSLVVDLLVVVLL